MPNRTDTEQVRKLIVAALKDGANSPRKVQQWIEQNSDIEAPSIPTIASAMKEEGYKPIGFVWAKSK
jgi:hypothetical protein